MFFFLTLHLCAKSELFTRLEEKGLYFIFQHSEVSNSSINELVLPFSRDMSRRWLPLTDTAPEPGWILHGLQLELELAAARPPYLAQLQLRITLKFAPNKTKGGKFVTIWPYSGHNFWLWWFTVGTYNCRNFGKICIYLQFTLRNKSGACMDIQGICVRQCNIIWIKCKAEPERGIRGQFYHHTFYHQ